MVTRVLNPLGRLLASLRDASRARRLTRTTDVLARVTLALPSVNRWIDELLAAHGESANPVSELGFTGLAGCFPASLLDATRVALVRRVPVPPMSAFGIPEFEALANTPMAGITFRGMYFIHESHSFESVHFHELVHAIQWRVLGSDDFLLTYAATVLRDGYARSPLEAMAFELDGGFKCGLRLPDIPDRVARGAVRARESAAAAFRACGLEFGDQRRQPMGGRDSQR